MHFLGIREIQRYRDVIKKIENKSCNEEDIAAPVKDAKEEKEKLVRELMGLERRKCEVLGCDCIEERTQNAAVSGSGTEERNRNDRMKVEELLTGAEPWKERIEKFEKMMKSMGQGFLF